MPAYHAAMRDLYQRLRGKGFDRQFIGEAILPEWWEDSLAAVPANRAIAETCLARHLGLNLEQLRDRDAELALPPISEVKFKRYRNRVDEKVMPSALVAQRAAGLVADLLADVPAFSPNFMSAKEVRRAILRENEYVDLRSLLDFCWRHGIIVIHLARMPQPSKRFDGMALFCGKRPVVVLGSARDSPPWLAFHLAHELAHIFLGHVKLGSPPLTDGDLNSNLGSDDQERGADKYACEVLTGYESPTIGHLGLTGVTLAQFAATRGPEQGIDPGIFSLIYGKSNDRWGVAQKAINALQNATGAQRMIGERVRERLQGKDVAESTQRFLSVLALTPPSADDA